MRVALAADHAGFQLKEKMAAYLKGQDSRSWISVLMMRNQ